MRTGMDAVHHGVHWRKLSTAYPFYAHHASRPQVVSLWIAMCPGQRVEVDCISYLTFRLCFIVDQNRAAL